jgi:steroid 5-alpha reductase family enzyme
MCVSLLSAYILQTEHFYDLTGSLTFLTLMAMSYASSAKTPRQTLATCLVLIWTLRLGTFLVLR